VSRMSGNSRKLQLLRQYTSGVSRATWPASMRRSVSTSRAAQRRRSIIMKGIRWPNNRTSSNYLARLTRSFFKLYRGIVATLYTRTVAVLLAGSLVLALYLLYQLSALLILFALCVTTSVLIVRLVLREEPSQAPQQTPLQEPQQPSAADNPEVSHQSAMSLNFPETPIPATPLIRVLETIDLSSSDVKHFINSTSEEQSSPGTIPQEQPVDMPMSE